MNETEHDGNGEPESVHWAFDGVKVKELGDPESVIVPDGAGMPEPGR